MTDSLINIIKKLFDVQDNYHLNDDMGPGDIPGWDSIGSIKLINKIQKEYNIELSIEEVAELDSIGKFRKLLNIKSIL